MLDYEGNTDRFANCGDLDEFDDIRDYEDPFDPWNCDNDNFMDDEANWGDEVDGFMEWGD